MKILVTGSSGTIGTRLCETLLEQGYDVVGVDYRKNEWSEAVQDITLNIDLRDKESVFKSIPKDVDAIIHLAANARVYNLVKNPSFARDNFETTFNILEFARVSKIKKFIFASSREVYGNTDRVIHSEEDSYVKNCESPYTATKIGGEALVHSYEQCYGIDFVIFRFSNVYGMYDGSDRLIPLFINLSKQEKDMTVFGAEKMLDFTYIDDVVEGIIQTINKFDSVKNDTYNLAYGEGVTLLEVAELVRRGIGSNSKIHVKSNRTGEVVKYIADISHAQARIGYTPKASIEEGVQKSIQWYSNNSLKEVTFQHKPDVSLLGRMLVKFQSLSTLF